MGRCWIKKGENGLLYGGLNAANTLDPPYMSRNSAKEMLHFPVEYQSLGG